MSAISAIAGITRGRALAAGLKGVLVRTGKYRPGGKVTLDPPPTCVADDLATADWIVGRAG